ncbi:MAG: hypothetical protein RLZZ08_1947 [Pseudomonadota bacterium]
MFVHHAYRLAVAAFLFLALALIPHAALAADPAEASASAQPQVVQVGSYILRINNVSQKDGTFDVDMWVWMRWKGSGLEPQKTFEIANGVINSRSDTSVLDDQGFHYSTVRVQATLFHQFDVKRFPLDNHRITIELEDSTYDASTLRYVADRGTALDPGLTVPGWKVGLERPVAAEHVYPTDYGMRSSATKSAVYSRLVLAIDLERNSMMVLFKEFWISILSVGLALLALFVHSHDLDARFGLGVGSIFAASANAFVLSDNLPKTTSVTLAEEINLLAVGPIFVTVFISIWSLRLRYADREGASLRLDKVSLIVVGSGYVIANLALLYL